MSGVALASMEKLQRLQVELRLRLRLLAGCGTPFAETVCELQVTNVGLA
jgi:hypothetical protein